MQPSSGHSAIVADKELCLPRCLFDFFVCTSRRSHIFVTEKTWGLACDMPADSQLDDE